MVSASVTACPAPMASSNTYADADDAGLPEAVGDASPFRSIHATKPIAAKMSFPMSCRGSARGARRIRVAQGEWQYQMCRGMFGDVRSTQENS